jgi:RimJ/RimL family protein N-acetyltransferase
MDFSGATVPALETPRLLLRSFREDDFEAYAEICADDESMKYIGRGKTLSRPDAWRNMAMMVGHWQLRGYGNWAVEEKSTGTFVGRIGFWNPHGWPDFEIGWLVARKFWGRGFATEGARAALNFGFDQLGRTRVISLIREGNVASKRVAEKLGLSFMGRIDVMGIEALLYEVNRNPQ